MHKRHAYQPKNYVPPVRTSESEYRSLCGVFLRHSRRAIDSEILRNAQRREFTREEFTDDEVNYFSAKLYWEQGHRGIEALKSLPEAFSFLDRFTFSAAPKLNAYFANATAGYLRQKFHIMRVGDFLPDQMKNECYLDLANNNNHKNLARIIQYEIEHPHN